MIPQPPTSTLFPYTTLFRSWTAQHAQSLKQAKLLTQGFIRDYPGSSEKGLLFIGPSGVGKTHLGVAAQHQDAFLDRKSTRLNSSHRTISYAVFCLKKKKRIK